MGLTGSTVFALAIAALLALGIGPLILSWRYKVEWIETVETTNPLVAASHAHRHLQLHEVVITGAAARAGALTIDVRCAGRGDAWARCELVGGAPADGELAALDGWCHTQVPLLLIDRDGDGATLVGPGRQIAGLHERNKYTSA